MKKDSDSILRVVWFFVSHYKVHFLFLMGLAVVTGILESLNVALMYPILSNGLLPGSSTDSSNMFLNFLNNFVKFIPIDDELVKYCILFMILAVMVFICKLMYHFYSAKITSKIIIDAKQTVFKKCADSDYQFFIDNKQGELMYKISTAPTRISGLLNIITSSIVELILSVSVFVLLLSMSLKGTAVILVGGVLYYYLTKRLSLKVHYLSGKKQLESGQTETVVVNEFTSGIKQIRVFETFDYWNDMYDKALHTYWKYARKSTFWSRVPETLLILLMYVSIGGAVIFLKLQYPGSFTQTLPLIGTFAFAVFLIIPKLSGLGRHRMNFMATLPNAEAVYNLIKDKTYNEIVNGTEEFVGLKSKISMEDIVFSHKERDVLLDGFSLEIKKDKVTALVGPSGSGKSTIVDLLLRFYDINRGSICIDDVNIKDIDIFTFLRKVGFVSQDTFIYNASVKDNIAFGERYTDQEILEAARLANADEFIRNTPEGYDTIVGDRGTRLSGGEKQRIAIARAMIRKPEILILDEATSSLDNVSEHVVQKAIDKVSKSCTTFIIAHRLSTIQKADIIYVLDEGRIVESGTHRELLRKKGKYYELYNIQRHKDEKKEE